MRLSDIDYWAINVLDRIKTGRPVEDSRVEIKATWVNKYNHVARVLAGHANAARGENILWIIGADESAGVIRGADKQEMSVWWPQVASEFESLPPSYVDRVIEYDGKTIAALLFETTYAPYVVKNKDFGKPGAGPVRFEVPWREGTNVRTATHNDLIRILVPLAQLPEVEILDATLVHQTRDSAKSKSYFKITLNLYVVPNSEYHAVIPFHRCKSSFRIQETKEKIDFDKLTLQPPVVRNSEDGRWRRYSLTIHSTETEVIIEGPGKMELTASVELEKLVTHLENDVQLDIELTPTGTDHSIPIRKNLYRVSRTRENEPELWTLIFYESKEKIAERDRPKSPPYAAVLTRRTGTGTSEDAYSYAIGQDYTGGWMDITSAHGFSEGEHYPYYGMLVEGRTEEGILENIQKDEKYVVVLDHISGPESVPDSNWTARLQAWFILQGMPVEDAQNLARKLGGMNRGSIKERLLEVVRTPRDKVHDLIEQF